MISLIIAEASLELVPKKLQNHKSVLSHAKKLGKKPSEILLDNSWHYAAMKGISNEFKRGRPDIVHLSLLESCTIPLYLENKLKIYIHTIDDKVILIGSGVHLPKSFHRFVGLIEKLYKENTIESKEEEGRTLLKIQDMSFSQLVDDIKPKRVVGLSSKGKLTSFETLAKNLQDNDCLVIGGFQKGSFQDKTLKKLDSVYSVSKNHLESHVVISRILYEYEKTVFM